MPVLHPGQEVNDFRIERLLGAGGMAEVYRARAPGRPAVALKLLPAGADRDLAARFTREVEHAARLDHPSCLRVYAHGIAPAGRYLVCELLHGLTLRDRLAAPIAARDAVRLTDELLAALAHAHARGVTHRDLKPENAVFRRRGVDRDLVLIDFGLSRALGDAPLTLAGTCVGSPSYLAPERILARADDGRADLYAVATILFEMLTGEPPYRADTPLETARLQLQAPVPDPTAHGVAPALAEVIRRGLQKAPVLRHPGAHAMRVALAEATRAQRPAPPPTPRRTAPLGARQPSSASISTGENGGGRAAPPS